jgi:hypothetical protein
MPEWLMQLLLAVITPVLAGMGWWIKTHRDDRVAEKLADVAEIKALRQMIFEMQQERIQYEMVRRESTDQTMKVLTELRTELLKAKAVQP